MGRHYLSFLFFPKTLDYEYTLEEPPHRDVSN